MEIGFNDTPVKPRKPRKRPGRRRISPALAQIATRSLEVDPLLLDAYTPAELDLKIAQAMLAGKVMYKDIAASIGVSAVTVSTRLRDPYTAAWVYRVVHRSIAHRLGAVDAAMLARAVAGDVRAADLLYRRYGSMIQRSLNVNINNKVDFNKFTDPDLDAFLAAEIKHVGTDRPRPENPDSASNRGEEAEA